MISLLTGEQGSPLVAQQRPRNFLYKKTGENMIWWMKHPSKMHCSEVDSTQEGPSKADELEDCWICGSRSCDLNDE